MSDRTCPECGSLLAPSWRKRGGHQTGGASCKVAKTARTMAEAGFTQVSGSTSVDLQEHGVPVRYGFVSPISGAQSVVTIGPSKKTLTGAFVPKYAALIFAASPNGMKMRAALARAATDPVFQGAILTIAGLSQDEASGREAVRAYLAAEGLL